MTFRAHLHPDAHFFAVSLLYVDVFKGVWVCVIQRQPQVLLLRNAVRFFLETRSLIIWPGADQLG